MTASDVETEISPPDMDEDGEDDTPSSMLTVTWLDVSETHYNSSIHFFGDDCEDPAKFGDALLRAALALAELRGPDHKWEAMRRFAGYHGGVA